MWLSAAHGLANVGERPTRATLAPMEADHAVLSSASTTLVELADRIEGVADALDKRKEEGVAVGPVRGRAHACASRCAASTTCCSGCAELGKPLFDDRDAPSAGRT